MNAKTPNTKNKRKGNTRTKAKGKPKSNRTDSGDANSAASRWRAAASAGSAQALDGLSEIAAATKLYLEGLLEGWKDRQKQRTGLFFADDIDAIHRSQNPLIRLETRHVPSHLTQGMIYLAASAGVFKNADDISRFTRDLMDHDQAAVQQWLRRVFNPEQAREISVWMDTAPGAEYAGGWAHRLVHGHDFSAMVELMQEHGLTGAAEWANHVWLRDFWTPHGVPFLPAGSGTMYEWLMDAGLSSSTAMGLLTINAAEAASGVLLYMSAVRVGSAGRKIGKARKYRKDFNQVTKLVEEGSEAEAVRLVGQIEAFSDRRGVSHLRLHLATFCLEMALSAKSKMPAAWGERSFSIARDLCRTASEIPENIRYEGGTYVSFHGLATTVMLTSVSSQVQMRQIDLTPLADQIDFGIRRFLALADRQAQKKTIRGITWNTLAWRPYSALTNLQLALDLSIRCGSLYNSPIDPRDIRARMVEILEQIAEEEEPHKAFAASLRKHVENLYPVQFTLPADS